MKFDAGMRRAAQVIAVCTALYHVYIGFFGLMRPLANYAITLSLFMCLVFLYVPFKGKGKRITIFDACLAALSLVVGLYIVVIIRSCRASHHGGRTDQFRVWSRHPGYIAGAGDTRRTIGWSLVCIALLFLSMAISGTICRACSATAVLEPDIVEAMYVTPDGIHGTKDAVVATLVIQFVLFGAFLEASGAAKFLSIYRCR
jgi:TRAP-type uncharacterized transport system fused permease subunit